MLALCRDVPAATLIETRMWCMRRQNAPLLLASSMTTVFRSPRHHSCETLAAFFQCSLPVFSNKKKGLLHKWHQGRESLPGQNLLLCYIKYRYILTLLQVQIFRSKYLTRNLVPITAECRDCKSNLIKYCLIVCVLGQKHYLEQTHVYTEKQHVQDN